jgi:hypothetical protein
MTTTIAGRTWLIVLSGALVGCGRGGGSIVHRASLASVHEYGVTACPQELGTIEVELGADAEAPMTLSVVEDLATIDVLDPVLGWPIVERYDATIAPGEVIALAVQFNCGTTEDVTGTIALELTPRGGAEIVDAETIPIALELRGAP